MIDPLTISTITNLGRSLIERIWPDPKAQAEQMMRLAELEQKGDLAELNVYVQQLQGQLAINLKEAENPSVWVSGWRPAIGWCGAGAMCYQFIIYPFLIWIWATLQASGTIPESMSPPPVLETTALMTIVTGMLGVGAMRSHDKRHGVDTKRIGAK